MIMITHPNTVYIRRVLRYREMFGIADLLDVCWDYFCFPKRIEIFICLHDETDVTPSFLVFILLSDLSTPKSLVIIGSSVAYF